MVHMSYVPAPYRTPARTPALNNAEPRASALNNAGPRAERGFTVFLSAVFVRKRRSVGEENIYGPFQWLEARGGFGRYRRGCGRVSMVKKS